VTARPLEEAQRYSRRSILRSEQMYGRGFQSPGGLAVVEAFCGRLDLRPGMRVLDIGSGLGGAAFYLATEVKADVVGLDVAEEMVQISEERRLESGLSGVRFLHGDIRTAALGEATFDLVWTRDCILYLAEKDVVWAQVARCIKPGGQLFVTDFVRGDGERSPAFLGYLEACSYHLQTLGDYAASLEAAGLRVTAREDITGEFITGLVKEKERLAEGREAFLGEFEPADFDHLMERWDAKIRFCRDGDMKWGLFVARSVMPA
jgi:phosphoethanolamine N-methyltransferase